MEYEGMWLKRLLSELKLEDGKQVEVMCDNRAISIAKYPIHYDGTKQTFHK